MKKFFMITPLQPVGINSKTGQPFDALGCAVYTAVGNSKLQYDKATRFPLIPVIHGYAEKGEEIRVITVTPKSPQCEVHLQQLREEVAALQAEKGFLCKGVESVSVKYSGDDETQIEILQKLLPLLEDNDLLYGCLTFGDKPMPIAEVMALYWAHKNKKNVSIDCLVYGQRDHNTAGEPMTIFDITAFIQAFAIVMMLGEQKVSDPIRVFGQVLSL